MQVFAQVIATGGLEGVAGSCMRMDESRFALDDVSLWCDLSGCLDAPQSIPAGSNYSTDRPLQTMVQRGEVAA